MCLWQTRGTLTYREFLCPQVSPVDLIVTPVLLVSRIVSSILLTNYQAGQAPGSSQILTIKVTTVRQDNPEFVIQLHSGDFHELQQQLDREIRNAKAIIIQQPLSEQFLQSLKEIVKENTRRARMVPGENTHPGREGQWSPRLLTSPFTPSFLVSQ